jgi:ATP-dependent DNA helicase MPH1
MSDFDDDDFDSLDDDALLQAAAQVEAAPNLQINNFVVSPRPAKRRRLSGNVIPTISPSEDQLRPETSDVDSDVPVENFPQFDADVRSAVTQHEDPYDYEQDLANLPSDALRTSPIPDSATSWYAVPRAPLQNLRQTTLFGRGVADATSGHKPPTARRAWPSANKQEPLTHHQLDLEAAKTWIYPTNIGKIRDYQFNIVQRGLFHNTLVALPTGLGKTFIAATIMLNWYRWTKDAKIIFVAPTKPLVSQQIHACANVTGIPYSQCAVLTGNVHRTVRQDQWETKRVFFMTPQTLQSDLSSGIADPKKIILLVVDEAHRAKGQYAYVQVVRKIRMLNPSFRILALTATPGGDVKAVQEVINGLDISRIEIRTDQSLDLREYVHDRDVETQVFKASYEMSTIMDLYSKAVKPLMDAIDSQLPTWMKDPISLTPYGCNQAMADWMKSGAGRNAHAAVKGRVITVMSLLGGLAHGMDLLKYHSLTAAWHKWKEFKDDNASNPKSKSSWKEKLFTNEHFRDMMDRLERWNREPDFLGHPKLEYLRSVVLNHLLDDQEGQRPGNTTSTGTRIMIFSSFRDSAEVIVNVLSRIDPMVKPHIFVGQADSKNSKGMTQKRQLEVIEQFKQGKYNTLIATSIGEEGLDIGEVDLIVCYDSKSSPLRMLQRMGRTGRKRSGKVVLLQMSGKEENDWAKAKDSYQTMQRKIAEGNEFTFHEEHSKRILPREIVPEVDKREVEIPVENSQVTAGALPPLPKKGKRKVTKKFHMPDDVETGFVTAGVRNGSTKRASKKKVSTIVDDEPEPLPYLDSVCLDADQKLQLENGYQNHHYDDDEDSAQLCRPALHKHPICQRVLQSTSFVEHGRATRSFVALMQKIGSMNGSIASDYEIYLDKALLEDGRDIRNVLISPENVDNDLLLDQPPPTSRRKNKPKTTANPSKVAKRGPTSRQRTAPESFDLEVGEPSSPPPSDPAYAMRSQAITLGSDDTAPPPSCTRRSYNDSEYDSNLDDFVVDDDVVIAEMEELEAMEDMESSLPSLKALRDGADYAKRRDFPMSTAETAETSSLPDLDEIMGRTNKTTNGPPKKQNGRKRRVLDSDDDDDDDDD